MTTSRHYYNALAKSYQDVSRNRSDYLAAVDAFVANTLEQNESKKLLDIGSGDGYRISRLTKDTDIEVWALENSEEMCAVLSETIARSRIFETDISLISNVAESFDAITALWNIFGHIESIEDTFDEIREKLNHGGLFMFDVNNPFNVVEYGPISSLRNWWRFFIRRETLAFNLERANTNTEVYFRPLNFYKSKLKSAGFSEIRVKYVNYSTGKITNRFSGQFYFECYYY